MQFPALEDESCKQYSRSMLPRSGPRGKACSDLFICEHSRDWLLLFLRTCVLEGTFWRDSGEITMQVKPVRRAMSVFRRRRKQNCRKQMDPLLLYALEASRVHLRICKAPLRNKASEVLVTI